MNITIIKHQLMHNLLVKLISDIVPHSTYPVQHAFNWKFQYSQETINCWWVNPNKSNTNCYNVLFWNGRLFYIYLLAILVIFKPLTTNWSWKWLNLHLCWNFMEEHKFASEKFYFTFTALLSRSVTRSTVACGMRWILISSQ